jgi:hypothetical protein
MKIKDNELKNNNDATAATDLDTELRQAMQSLRKSRTPPAGEPPVKAKSPKAPARAKAPPKAKPKARRSHISEIAGDTEEDGINRINLDEQLTLMEQKFIEFRLVGKLNIEDAMKLSGYAGYSPSYLYKLGRKIIQKYECLTDDHRKIMRAMGYGETKIIEMLIDSAENAKSEMVKLAARIALAKCLGLQKEVVEVEHGMNIIIRSRSQQPAVEPVPGGTRPALIHQAGHKPGPKTISITK